MEVDDSLEIKAFKEKPKTSTSNLASMGIYLFDVDLLKDVLKELPQDDLDFGHHIIPHIIQSTSQSVYAYKFEDYWQDVGTYDSYLETNLELNSSTIDLDLYDPSWKVFTKSEDLPAVKFGAKASIKNSLVSNGCVIEGTVINSVLSPGVRVGKDTVIEDSVILNHVIISDHVSIKKAIIDKKVVIGRHTTIGDGPLTPNIEKPDLLSSGITVIEKSAVIPSQTHIGKNCRIFKSATFTSNEIPSGTTLK